MLQSDVNTVCFADESGHLIYSGSDDNLCKVSFNFFSSSKKVVCFAEVHSCNFLFGCNFIFRDLTLIKT